MVYDTMLFEAVFGNKETLAIHDEEGLRKNIMKLKLSLGIVEFYF